MWSHHPLTPWHMGEAPPPDPTVSPTAVSVLQHLCSEVKQDMVDSSYPYHTGYSIDIASAQHNRMVVLNYLPGCTLHPGQEEGWGAVQDGADEDGGKQGEQGA